MNSLVLAAAIAALTAGQTPTYTDPVIRFTVTVPAGWSLLTADELADVDRRQRHGINAAKEECRMRLAGSGPTSLPFIAVKHGLCQPTLEYARDELPAASIDERHKAVLFSKNETGPDGQVITRTSALFPCRAGTATVIMVCRQAEVEQYRPTFQSVVDSASFESGYGYEESPTSTQSPANRWLLLWVLPWVALVVVVVYLFRRRVRMSDAGSLTSTE
jgi:hypothetical protein